jgi:hypothetical protein
MDHKSPPRMTRTKNVNYDPFLPSFEHLNLISLIDPNDDDIQCAQVEEVNPTH